jgi:hypothetical protein
LRVPRRVGILAAALGFILALTFAAVADLPLVVEGGIGTAIFLAGAGIYEVSRRGSRH